MNIEYYIDYEGDIWKNDSNDKWFIYDEHNHVWKICTDRDGVEMYIKGTFETPKATKIDENDLFLEFI